ncbi:MAG: hypothetical protein KC910_32310, partial [Candidatus Eremiobacteraeota bacterium]|nr:hypothetical protein [Candidatus Eremiobacteraeota bacterium]
MGLEHHLEDQRRAGKLESSGQFTLSREAALEKLAQYGLADPELAPLKLSQTAMQLGCPELLLTHRAGHLEMIMPGANLDVTRLGFENLTEISGNELLETFKLTLMS